MSESNRPSRFRKKPVVIDALEYDGLFGSALDAIAFVGETHHDGAYLGVDDGELYIRTLEGPLHVSIGDWIIRGVQGECYPCKPGIFEATYEPA